ncbi:MAG: radical SAM protein [Alphaproteobacteria bacterium]|nr:radical SAM protein [Alphaproteobacteria bacterium]
MNKPFVTFVRCPIVFTPRAINNEATPSIAFAYLAGYIRGKGYECAIIDGIAEGLNRVWTPAQFPSHRCQGLNFEEIIGRIPQNTDVLAFSAMFSGEWPVNRELIKAVTAAFPKAMVIVGGEHITALTQYSLNDCPEIDVCVRGEGEHTLFEILECVTEGSDWRRVGGISYLDQDGRYVENGTLPRIRDIDEIPWPWWPEGYLEKFWQAGKSFGVLTKRDMPMMISRGCPYQCTFCSNARMWTTRYILRDIEDIIAEVKTYIARYDITAVQLYDLTAITKKAWTMEFGRRLLEEGIHLKWSLPSGTRSEALDDDTLGMLRDIGCNYLVYAPESGSPRTLERIKKRVDLAKITQSVVTAKANGLVLRTNLMIGFPGETRSDIVQTIRYGLKLAWFGADEVSLNLYAAYPGTELFEQLLAAGRLIIGDPYFLRLTSMYSDYTTFDHMTTNENISPSELAFYRVFFMFVNYCVGYLRFPGRIFRTIGNILRGGEATTVLEHRLRDAWERRRGTRGHS